MKRIFTCLYIVIGLGVAAFSQQEAQFTHNMFNNMFFNPAYAGSNEAICFTGIGRQQWVGFKDNGNDVAPKTYLVSLDAPVNLLHGGLGASIYQDQIGYFKTIGVKLSYGYRFNLGNGIMSAGLQVGFLNNSLDFSKLKPLDEGDVLLSDKNKQSNFITDFGFGLFYKVPQKYFVGISTSQLSEAGQGIGKANLNLKRHYYIMGGYEYPLPNYPEFEIDPSILIKTDGVAAQYDVNALVRYNNKFWGGVNYRVQDALSLLVGMQLNNIKVGYAYDITTSKLRKASSGSHEIMVGYCFKIVIVKPRVSYRNTRFL